MHDQALPGLDVSGFYLLLWTAYYPSRVTDPRQVENRFPATRFLGIVCLPIDPTYRFLHSRHDQLISVCVQAKCD